MLEQFSPIGSGTGPSVLIMARAPRRGEVRRGLEEMIGADGCVALQLVLIKQAVAWGRELEPRGLFLAHEPADAGRELRTVAGEDVSVFPQNGEGIAGRLADAAGRVFTRVRGPLVIVWPDLPRLRADHAQAVLSDLAAGVDVVLGPLFDGGFYMIALSRPLPSLFALPEQIWRGADAMTMGLAAAQSGSAEIGILRAERPLHRPADVRAALIDPLLPGDVAQALRRAASH
jgi:glycosyltransferase A (GT-A) superfamily protein (DUF2064 family)